MSKFNIAILGCGTVGGGVAKIILENQKVLAERAGIEISLKKIVDIFPKTSSEKHGIPREYFCTSKDELTKDEAGECIKEVLASDDIDLIVETIGGSNPFILNLAKDILNSGKNLVTANKALLAKYNKEIFDIAYNKKKAVGFEAAVCGAIPVIKGINESFTGDEVLSMEGILNGTSNYILSKMDRESYSFEEALKMAQDQGYAEADPSLDINGGDAGHKLIILLKIIFGLDVTNEELSVNGIENITTNDTNFAKEMDCVIKLIGYAKKDGNNVYAAVKPMMVKNNNLLSDINNATNAVKLNNKYSFENVLIGEGAGSTETGSAIVSDIVFIARHGEKALKTFNDKGYKLASFDDLEIPYIIIFETEDIPGITGIVTTAIGNQKINIDTVSHNVRNVEKALFSVATAPCTYNQIKSAINTMKSKDSNILTKDPKVIPILK